MPVIQIILGCSKHNLKLNARGLQECLFVFSVKVRLNCAHGGVKPNNKGLYYYNSTTATTPP